MILNSFLLGTAAGAVVSAIYFGGLWWSVQRLAATGRSGWWLGFSFLARFLLFAGSTAVVVGTAPSRGATLLGIIFAFVIVRELARKRIDRKSSRH